MILTDTGSGTTFEQPPAGSHVARCIGIIDLGTQKGTYEGETQSKHQLIVRWELSNELMTEGEHKGKPFTVSKFYTASLHEKSGLRKHLAAWRSRDFTPEELKGFDLKTIIGKACMLSVVITDKGKAKVEAVMALPKGTVVPDQVNPSFNFSMSGNEFSAAAFEALSKGFKEMVTQSPEYQAIINRNKAPARTHSVPDMPEVDEDCPF